MERHISTWNMAPISRNRDIKPDDNLGLFNKRTKCVFTLLYQSD